jgi:GNAT superfamily N-acetyltransferase
MPLRELDERPNFDIQPLTPERWEDLEKLFGERGAVGGCWCMWWRIKRSEFERQRGDANKTALKTIVESGEVPGLLAYVDSEPIGWCSIGPREAYPVLQRSRTLKPVDDKPVWSVVCFFIAKPFRRRGVMVRLLRASIDYARAHGATIIEGYPVEPREEETPDTFAYTGIVQAFREVGFVEVARRSAARPIMRYMAPEAQ